MGFEPSARSKALAENMTAFMEELIYPNERRLQAQIEDHRAAGQPWTPLPLLEELKDKARARQLWNLFLPRAPFGAGAGANAGANAGAGAGAGERAGADASAGLTNLEYAPLCEIMGRSPFAPEVFNCSAPDTGNMEVLARYGTPEQQERWLKPLLEGRIRSAFAMTEPGVASSDATNVEMRMTRDGDAYVLNGRKWWTSGAYDPRCQVLIVMGQTSPDNPDVHRRQSMILVPMDTPGVRKVRSLQVFGYDQAPHGHAELEFQDVRVPATNMLLGEGRGFEIAQGRLGPGRVHHCMRLIGLAERALELMCRRTLTRVAFGRPIADQGVTRERIAEARMLIDQARLLVLNTAEAMDRFGNKHALKEIAMIKVVAPNMACEVIDWAIQAHGGAGVSEDFPLAAAWATARTLRLADGPDEVHRNQIAKLELARYKER